MVSNCPFEVTFTLLGVKFYLLHSQSEQLFVNQFINSSSYSDVRKIESNYEDDTLYMSARTPLINSFSLNKTFPECIYTKYYNASFNYTRHYYFFKALDIFKLRIMDSDNNYHSPKGTVINSLNMGAITSDESYILSKLVYYDTEYFGSPIYAYLLLEQREKGYVLAFPVSHSRSFTDNINRPIEDYVSYAYYTLYYKDLEKINCCIAEIFGITE